jgi:subtilisin family serine protease
MLLPLLILANVVPGPRGIKPLFSENILKLQLSQEAMKSIDLPETLTASIDKLGINEIDDIISSYGKAKIYRAHIRLKDKAFENKHGVDRWILVKFENKIDVFSALDACKEKKQWIDWASPETYFYTTAVPNDTYYANNWGHNNTAQLPVYSGGSHSGAGVGTVGFDTDAQLAWDQSQGYGSAAIIIAVIDTGVDTAHPDLRLVTGYDYGDIDADPMDDSDDPGHGTACSGVTAGIANNGLGVTGIAGGCSVMPIKIATSAGTLSGTAIENAQYHIGDNNVDVASMSYGGSYDYGDYPSSDTAYNYAYTHGVVLLAATANDNSSTITYPANHPYVISVGAASPTGQRKSDTSSDGEYWWGSNYGTATMDARDAVDIMAPTILPATDITGTGNGYNTSSDYYMWFNGTSCATPYAAGVAALLLSKEPTLTQAQVRTALTSTATDMTFDGGAGWDRYTGYGLINANNALLSLVPGMPTCTITSPAAGTIFNLNETVTINVTATDSDGTISSVQFYIDDVLQNTDISLPYTWNWDTTGYSGGSYAIKAIATDNSSNSVQNTITVTLLAPADEGFESGGFGAYAWSNISASPWTVQSSVTFSGTYAAKSGVIGNSTSTSLSLPMNVTSAGNISFYQMISSESGYDFLKFYIDGDLQGQWSGGGIWTQQTYAVTSGVRTFTWTYSKDSTTTGGSDCAYLDHIIFPPNEVYFAPPQNLTAIPGNTVVNLAWQAPASGTPTGYDIYKNSIFSTNVMALAYTDNAVVNGTSYSYHLKAVYSEGESEATATVYATPTDAVATEVILGTGTSVTGTSTASPINIYYKSLHGQSVYTAAELIAGGVTGPINITQIGFNVVTLPTLALPNFLIRMKHTSATDVSSWQTATGMSTVYTSASYMPTAGGYDMLTLSTPFLWNGTDNIVIDTAFSPVSDYSSTGTVQYTSLTNGYRYARSDTADQTAIFAGTSTSANRPNVKLTLMPSAAGPLITVDPTSLSFGNVVVNATSTMQFTIQNIGDEELSGSITTPAGYSVALSASKNELIIGSNVRNSNRVVLPFNINAGQSKTYDLSFIPPSVGSFNGNVVISSDAVNFATVNIGVTGNGYIQPTIEVSTTLQSASLIIGAESSETFTISNNGSLSLNYSIGIAEVRSLKNIATSRMLKTDSGKSISGSTFDVNVAEFTPGTTEDWIFTVYNGSDDTEWLKDLYLTFPAGVVVNSVSNFVGGTGGELVPDLTTGSGITINWHGETSGGWGFIQGNESAVATVNVTIAAGNSTPISLDYQLNGDVYGAEPHILTGAIILPPSTPPITWYSASPLSGTIAGGGQQHITGSFSAIGLDIGSYEALLSISSDDPVNPLETVQISLEVTPANSAPTIVLPESFQFDMNESLMVDFSTYVNDVDADELILEYSGNTNIHVAIEGLNVTFTALEDWYGDEELTFTVSDGSEEAFDTVMVTVNQVISYLDAPIVSINREESFVLLEWDAVANANEYWVFRAVTPEEQFVKINETTELSYEDYDELDKAFYQVKAVFVTPLKGN